MGCSAYLNRAKVILLSVFIGLLITECHCKKIPKWWLRVAEKQGPNVCVVEEIPGTNKEFWTECRYWLNREICGVKTLTRFECCEGFNQLEDEEGCRLVKPMRNILETADSLGATEWVNYIRQSGRQHELEGPGAYTLFVPTNDAFNTMSDSLREQLNAYRGNPSNPIISYHLVPSKLKSDDFNADLTVETFHQGHNLRINKYSNGMTTINCALLVRKDQQASNGIVHVIDGVLDPSQGIGSNMADMILKDGRFQVLSEMLETSGYINVLRNIQGSISIFAPSDEAFQKIPESRIAKIINDREAMLALLKNHVIPHVICESAITGEHRVRNLGSNKLTFNCGVDGAYVDNTKLKSNFFLGQNGIAHMIDDVLLPDRAKNLIELAESRYLETFVDLVRRSGLEETLSHTGDYTFFVPDENAWFDAPPEVLERAKSDSEFAGLMLRYHGAYGRHLTKDVTDNQAIMSLDEENPVRLQTWRRAMGVEDAKILKSDLEAQNGVIHIIDRVIFPSNRTFYSVLASMEGDVFNTFLDAMNTVSVVNPGLINLNPSSDVFYTFFVPSDRAFSRMDQNQLDDLLTNMDSLTNLVKNHIAINMFPGASFDSGLTYTIDGMLNEIIVKKSKSGVLNVNGVRVTSSHNSANGIIHVLEDVLVPDSDNNLRTSIRKTSVSTVSRKVPSLMSSSFSSKSSTSSRSSYEDSNPGPTYGESYIKDLQSSLRPKGSTVYASSTGKKPQHVLPQNLLYQKKKNPSKKFKVSRKRTRKYLKKIKSRKNRNKNKQLYKQVEHVTQIPNSMNINKLPTPTFQPYKNLKIDEYAPLEYVARKQELASKTNGTISDVSNLSVNKTNTVDHIKHPTLLTSAKSYIYKGEGWEIPYKEPSFINQSIVTRKFYNSSTNYPPYHPPPQNYYNRPLTQTNSNTYSYKYISKIDNYNHNPVYGYNMNDNSSLNNDNSFSDLSPGKKFSYVGHHYGNDIAGRRSPMPYSRPRASYVTRGSHHGTRYQKPYDGKFNDKFDSNINYASSRTDYSVPTSVSHQTFTFPIERKLLSTFGRDSKNSFNILPDNAFTGNADNFADGNEFLTMAHPPEEYITKRQALYRRLRRKKRHHKKRKNNHSLKKLSKIINKKTKSHIPK